MMYIVGFGIQFMTNAGLEDEDAFNLGVVQNCVGLIGCIIAWWIMTNVGRRRLYMSGLSGIFVILMIVGFLGIAPDSNTAASWAVGVLIVIMLLVFQVILSLHAPLIWTTLNIANSCLWVLFVTASPLKFPARNTASRQWLF